MRRRSEAGKGAAVLRLPAVRARRMGLAFRPVHGGGLGLDPVAEGADLRAILPPRRADEEIGPAGVQRQVEGHDEPPGAQFVVRENVRREQNSRAFRRRVERVVGAAEAQSAAEIDAVSRFLGNNSAPVASAVLSLCFPI